MARKPKSKNPFLRPNSKVWWIRYTVNGKQERESTKTTVYAEAVIKALDQRRGDVAVGKYRGRDIERITIGDLLNDLEKDYIDRGRSSLPALRSYQRHLLPPLANIKASNF